MALNQKQKQYLYDEVFKAAFHKQLNHHRSMDVQTPSMESIRNNTERGFKAIREETPSKCTLNELRNHINETFLYEEAIIITDGLSILLLTDQFITNSLLPPNQLFNVKDDQCLNINGSEWINFEMHKSIKLMDIAETCEKGKQGFAVKPSMALNPDIFKHILSVKEVYKLVRRIGLMSKLNIQ